MHSGSPEAVAAERVASRIAMREGFAQAAPFMVAVLPFGMLYGLVATEAGLGPGQAMALTSMVFAGASQFALIELLSHGAPAIVALLAALAVNLRMAMYSASLAPHLSRARPAMRVLMSYFLADQVYGLATRRWAERREPLSRRVTYYLAVALPVSACWLLASALGVVAGDLVPKGLPLDFLAPAMFLAMVGPMIRGVPNICAAAAAVVVSLLFAWAPWNLGLAIGAGAGMGVGALTELRLEARKKAREGEG